MNLAPLVLATTLAACACAFAADPSPVASTPAAAASAPRPKSMTGCGKPDYPPSAIRARETGTTRVRLEVSDTGETLAIRLVASAGSSTLDDAALSALKTCHFTPARDEHGQAVAVVVPLEYVWKLDPPPADSLATASTDGIRFSGTTALLPHQRRTVLRKLLQAGGEADDCFDITTIDSRPLSDDYALPVKQASDARELWIARQCGVARVYVLALRTATFGPDEIHVWPAGPAVVGSPVAPLPGAASITETQVRAEYDRARARAGSEYHARRIVAASIADAQEALDRIHAGEPFDSVARRMSTDTGTAAKGGDLGWITDRSQAGPIGATLRSLAPLGLSRAPVHADAGWQVIEVTDIRPAPSPDYGSIKDKLAETLRARAQDGL